MLWRVGDNSLAIFEVQSLKVVETIPNFWMFNSMIGSPIAAIANKSATRILGLSRVPLPENQGQAIFPLHYYERRGPDFQVVPLDSRRLFDPQLHSINSLQVSTNGQMAFVGQVLNIQNNRIVGLSAHGFSKDLPFIDRFLLSNMPELLLPSVIKRLNGADILFMGSFKHILVLQFLNNKFALLHTIQNAHTDLVTDMAVRGNIMYSKGLKESFVRVTRFGQAAPSLPPVAPIITSPSEEVFVPKRYNIYKTNKVLFEPVGVLEKVAVAPKGNVIYTGGSAGLNLLKFNDGTQRFEQIKSPVNWR